MLAAVRLCRAERESLVSTTNNIFALSDTEITQLREAARPTDEQLWLSYAAAALNGHLAAGHLDALKTATVAADAMLSEHRKRFPRAGSPTLEPPRLPVEGI